MSAPEASAASDGGRLVARMTRLFSNASSMTSWASSGSMNVSVAYVRMQTSVTRLVAALRRSTTSFFRAALTEVGETHSEAASLAVREAFFFEDPSLLRGTRLAQVLHGFGKVLEDSKGSAATYELSHTVTHIDWFISHNWSVGRWPKFMALQLHFHGCQALVAAAVMWFLAFVLTVGGAVPVVEDREGRFSISSFLVVLPTFGVYLCFVPEAVRCLGLWGPTVFLDKTSIHQTDMELKRQGITKLGAFLRKSSGMVIIYSDVYLRKLWTVYEVACFLFVKPEEPIFLVPLYLHKFALWGCLTSSGLNFVLYVLRFHGIAKEPNTIFIVGVFRFMCVAFFFRRLAQALKKISHLVQHFSVQDTICFDESDRPLVYHNIAMFMEVAGLVPAGEPEPEALEKFNGLVKGHLGKALRHSIGTAGLPYHLAVAYFLNHFSYNADMEMGELSRERNPAATTAYLLWFAGFVLAVGPLGLVLFCTCMRRLRCGFEDRHMFVFMTLAALISIVLHFLYTRLFYEAVVKRSADSTFCMSMQVVIFFGLLALTLAIYRPLPCSFRFSKCCRRLAAAMGRSPSASGSLLCRPLPTGSSSADLAHRAALAAAAARVAARSDASVSPKATAIGVRSSFESGSMGSTMQSAPSEATKGVRPFSQAGTADLSPRLRSTSAEADAILQKERPNSREEELRALALHLSSEEAWRWGTAARVTV